MGTAELFVLIDNRDAPMGTPRTIPGRAQSTANLVDAIDAAPRLREDEMLLALIRLAQTGHQLAGRVVLRR